LGTATQALHIRSTDPYIYGGSLAFLFYLIISLAYIHVAFILKRCDEIVSEYMCGKQKPEKKNNLGLHTSKRMVFDLQAKL
jgi:hypothetical protein